MRNAINMLPRSPAEGTCSASVAPSARKDRLCVDRRSIAYGRSAVTPSFPMVSSLTLLRCVRGCVTPAFPGAASLVEVFVLFAKLGTMLKFTYTRSYKHIHILPL